MTKEEIKEYLKDNLQISVNVKEITGYYESDKSYYKIEVGIDLSESTQKWMLSDLIEVGFKGYSSIGKIGKRKENILLKVCNELESKLVS